MKKRPFFTICTEVTNREKTIERTLRSISNQSFFDYEYVIVNNCSNDKSHDVISNYLRNDKVLNGKTTYIKLETRLADISSWNKPLEFSNGKYIVVCEGDDWFENDHLDLAYDILSVNNDIGMYISLRVNYNTETYCGFQGYVPSNIMFDKLISFDCVPPPSQLIFRRELNGVPFNYDSDNYVYAGELSLYHDLLTQGLSAYVNNKSLTVNRGLSSYRKGFFHIKDMYFSFDKWRKEDHYVDNEAQIRVKLFKSILRRIFIPQLIRLTVERKMLFHVFREIAKIGVIYSFIIFFTSLVDVITKNLTYFSKRTYYHALNFIKK